MDWTMVNNAKGSKDRVQTIFYLFRFRYEADAKAAGARLADESSGNHLCRQTIAELREELATPSKDLGMVRIEDSEVRNYLGRLLAAYDERVEEPKWAPRDCPVCGTKRGEPYFEKGSLRVVRCSSCGMLFANPIEAQYVEGTFYDQLAAPYHLSPDKLESDYASVRFTRELGLFRRFCRGGSVLDVGCSTGAFLHQLAKRYPGDYTTLGHDVAGPALDYAETRGVPVLRTPFVEHDFGGQQFDAVTFWAVLEHLAEPRTFLVKASAVLKPGGHCFVLVPNMKSLAVRWLGPRYRYIMDEHLNYFDSKTLRRFVGTERSFSMVAMKSTHFNPMVLWQDRRGGTHRVPDDERAALLKRTTALKQNPLLAPMKWIYSGIERLLGGLRLADNLVVVLRRK